MKLAIVFNDHKLSGWLTKIGTGCYAYHAFWVDEDAGLMYDMHLIRRRRIWPHYQEGQVILFDAPANVTSKYLEDQLNSDENRYGVGDYILFLLRPFFHLFGKSTPNVGGLICSEMVNLDIWNCGGTTPWSVEVAPPSPCDLYRWLKS